MPLNDHHADGDEKPSGDGGGRHNTGRKKRARTTNTATTTTITTTTTAAGNHSSVVVPDPPPSLIALLQSDRLVHEYFSALQSHLTSDIEHWKSRALQLKRQNQNYQSQLRSMQNQQQQQQQQQQTSVLLQTSHDTTVATTAEADNDGNDDAKRTTTTKATTKPHGVTVGIPLDDTLLDDIFDASDSDDDDEKSNHHGNTLGDTNTKMNRNKVPTIHGNTEDDTTRNITSQTNDPTTSIPRDEPILNRFREVYDIFQHQLGIPLVHIAAATTTTKTTTTSSTDKINDDSNNEVSNDGTDTTSRVITPNNINQVTILNQSQKNRNKGKKKPAEEITARTDREVITDLLNRITNNTLRVGTNPLLPDGNSVTHAETNVDLVRTCNGNDVILSCNPLVVLNETEPDATIPTGTMIHSLLQGKRILFQALVLMDTLCSSSIPNKQWDAFFTQLQSVGQYNSVEALMEMECIRIGLRNRRSLVDTLLQEYLIPDVTLRWACIDQSRAQLPSSMRKYDRSDRNPVVDNTMNNDDDDDATRKTYFCGNLIERSILCQLSTGLLILRNDVQGAAQNVCRYITSTTMVTYDSHEDEEPLHSAKLTAPPLLSFNALEGLLLLSDPSMQRIFHDVGVPNATATYVPSLSWFERCIDHIHGSNCQAVHLFFETFLLAINNAAVKWERQTLSADVRVRDVAVIEMSSYRRVRQVLQERRQNQIKEYRIDTDTETLWIASQIVQSLLNDTDCTWKLIRNVSETDDNEVCYWPLSIAAILGEKIPLVERCMHDELQKPMNGEDTAKLDYLLRTLVTTKRQVELTQRYEIFDSMDTPFFPDFLFDLVPKIMTSDESRQHHMLCTILQCSVTIADGRSALCTVNHLLQIIAERPETDWTKIQSIVGVIRRHCTVPVVRVINLERRKDRMRAFTMQAIRERLLVVKAVTDSSLMTTKAESIVATEGSTRNVGDGCEFGRFAIDGQGRLVEATARLVQYFESMDIVNSQYVQPHWRPNDLKPFDVDAPSNDSLMVRVSPSERACALSHILSWRGVLRSLQSTTTDSSLDTHLLRLYKITGYAHGPALLKQNHGMPPTPVCLILEDDAILVDRFTDRLEEILLELPRDFHFCSLGYSRPKSAPIIPYSDHVGIPSMLWYLTGYCISAAGAQFLLDALPVVGPVDSWIGLKMTGNWDNTFGTRLGVGIHSKLPPSSAHNMPSLHDLGQILQFRAYCSRRPLCHQKVRVSTTALTGGSIVATKNGRRQWRQRDTDIEYSGGSTGSHIYNLST